MAQLSLASVLAESARRRPEHPAIICGDERVTYAQLWAQARGYAAALAERGVRRGDRVALMAANVPDFPRAYYAILSLGAVVVPIHLLLTAEEVAFVLRDSGARVVVHGGGDPATAVKAAELAGVPAVPLDPADPDSLVATAASLAPRPGLVPTAPDDAAVVLYTSGTTGRPKGAVLTHLNLTMNATVNAFDDLGVRRDDVILGCLPLFHSFGQTAAMNTTFRAAATLVLQPRFDPARALELMVAQAVTAFLGVPTMYAALVDAARRGAPRPSLRLCVSGGASLPVSLLEEVAQMFATTVYEGYGLSETSPVATTNQPTFGARPGTVGCHIWGVDVEVARADLERRVELLPPGEIGEIVIRGHNVFAGYLGQPRATAEAIVDGWFRTGDLGARDEAGFVTIVDRKKDLIIRGGFNVYPREVEEALLRHPAVGQVAVIGVPHPTHGEEVCAVVIPAAEVTADEIVEWSREHLGRHKYPRRVEFVGEFPLGPSMKVLKRELRWRFAQDARP
ncbi:long-chain fatty acid--CoA ligase [Micromonospora sp. 4G57]|uniref:Long-chain fatty acid--CoA ligase n=1 Tax=Micromonospora sicca TaxID=2202420 RepID=A0ABU5JJA1_9ACTN|nr:MULTISPECIES: long-chain fatty acid--CoA ligase [unclassified Micromonospora]MDZ5445917.1 long-chain fatty acid--CoA ligase [Micromonospora sp. 4G57]MDZ5492703.1 long-chain fatty acid--CoA ligase [Micromonospora sp. 4G53]